MTNTNLDVVLEDIHSGICKKSCSFEDSGHPEKGVGTRLCQLCFRTEEEVEAWSSVSGTTKLDIIRDMKVRKAAYEYIQ